MFGSISKKSNKNPTDSIYSLKSEEDLEKVLNF